MGGYAANEGNAYYNQASTFGWLQVWPGEAFLHWLIGMKGQGLRTQFPFCRGTIGAYII